jgi:penicillin-binding protein 2
MPRPAPANDEQRLHLAGAALLLGLAVLLGGLAYVQVVTALEHEAEQKNQSRRTVRLPAVRGAILDTQGRPLAHDRPSYVIHAYLEELRHHFRKAWREAPHDTRTEAGVRHQVVSDFIAQLQLDQPFTLTEGQLQKHFIEQLALPIPVMRDLSQTNVAWFMENAWRVPGMDVEAQPHRDYPSESVAHLVGRLRRPQTIPDEDRPYNYRLPDFTGAMGLERTFNETLRGSAGTKSLLVNNLGYRQREEIVVAPEPGNNVVLTLDLEIQEAAYQALKETGRKGAAAVVMNVQTGDLIALVSLPVFDPNAFIPGIRRELWNEYREARPSPLLFRATQERYPPGSIFKIISGLAALEAGSNPTNFVYNPGYAEVGRRRIDDTAPPGHYDFHEGFKHSSNTYFITRAIETGAEHIIALGNQFFLREKTGLLARQEAKPQFPTLAEVQNRRNWQDGDTANLAIGQGPVAVTPLQMTVMTAAIANGGKVFAPRVVGRIAPVDPTRANESKQFPPAKVRGTLNVKPENLTHVQRAMLADVADDDGTGKRARIEGFAVCGKTGTAEVHNREGRHKITWFASYGPFEKPKYAVVVMVERGASGGLSCAPAAKKIYEALIARDNPQAVAGNR